MKRIRRHKSEVTQWLVVLVLAIALALTTGCAKNKYYNDSVPCELLFCTDYSTADEAFDNGVFNELCGMDCEE